ncbi:MAG: arylamine N-acetyltransferase [Kiritimatiellaeota bacterium]|nr:arylamine N-acetyltransferase [Kiritimatiellota bacterium]
MDSGALPLVPSHRLPIFVRQAWAVASAMPFENLTKSLKHEMVSPARNTPLRLPAEVLADHRRFGTGATCFALAFLFRDRLARGGLASTLHACDRRYGPDAHAAVVVPVGSERWLFDPGYHIVQPLPAEGGLGFRSPENPNASYIRRVDDVRFECYTGHAGEWRLRFVLKDVPLDERAFQEKWRRSFQAEMMAYPVLTRFEHGRMLYLQKSTLVVRDANGGTVRQVPMRDLADAIHRWFGIAPEIVDRALRVWRSR